MTMQIDRSGKQMIIDVHTHIFPGKIRKNREKYFSAEPAFQKLYQSPKSRLIGSQEMLASMDANCVDKTVVFGFPWQNPLLFKQHNDYIGEVVSRYPERFIGLGCLTPSVMKQLKKPAAACKRALYPESGNWLFTNPASKMLPWRGWSRLWRFAGFWIFRF